MSAGFLHGPDPTPSGLALWFTLKRHQDTVGLLESFLVSLLLCPHL